MSGARTAEDDRTDDATDAKPTAEETERVARAHGWRPKEEMRDPSRFVTAEQFVARGLESPAILRERNRVLESRFGQLEKTHSKTTSEMKLQLEEAVSTIATLTDMTRKAEERAYARARRELKKERDEAVAAGDTNTFQRLDTEIEELDKTRPVAPAAKPPPPANVPPPPPAQGEIDPAIQKFYRENSWYLQGPQNDPERVKFADRIYFGTRAANPTMSEADLLEEVVKEVEARFPDKYRRPNRAADDDDQQEDPPPRRQARRAADDDEENPRRSEAGSVSSSGDPPPRRSRNRRNFDSMPADSKQQFDRYAKMLAGKGKPLTKEEWAAEYWAQFPEDGT